MSLFMDQLDVKVKHACKTSEEYGRPDSAEYLFETLQGHVFRLRKAVSRGKSKKKEMDAIANREAIDDPLSALLLTPRSHNALLAFDVFSVAELCRVVRERNLKHIPQIGAKSADEIRQALARAGRLSEENRGEQ